MKYPKTLSQIRKLDKVRQQQRKHFNAKFYSSTKWIKFRRSYIERLTEKQMTDITDLSINDSQKLHLLNNIPVCEECYRLYVMDVQPSVKEGRELDHITPINPENAMDTLGIYGQPFPSDNGLQLLCHRHHSEKSNRDRTFNNKIK